MPQERLEKKAKRQGPRSSRERRTRRRGGGRSILLPHGLRRGGGLRSTPFTSGLWGPFLSPAPAQHYFQIPSLAGGPDGHGARPQACALNVPRQPLSPSLPTCRLVSLPQLNPCLGVQGVRDRVPPGQHRGLCPVQRGCPPRRRVPTPFPYRAWVPPLPMEVWTL